MPLVSARDHHTMGKKPHKSHVPPVYYYRGSELPRSKKDGPSAAVLK